MNNRRYLEVVFTIGLVVVAVIGYALVSALDRTRFEIEKLHSTVKELNEKMESGVYRPAASSAAVSASAAVPLANAEFYDRNAVFGDRFVTSIASDTKNMNYIINNEATIGTIWSKAMDSLAELNYQDLKTFEPQLAESWSMSDDGLTYRIKLRKGIP